MKKQVNTVAIRKFAVANMLGIGAILFSQATFGITFVLPHNGNVVGHVQYTNAQYGDTLSTIGRAYDIGGYEMVEANPGVDYKNPRRGSTIVIPSKFVLPEGPRKGVVINIAEMRLYVYHTDGVHVSTFPIGIGQEGWNTPMGATTITRMREHPTWVVPDSIMENERNHGVDIPKVMPPGPKNPLGDYAMSLGFKSIVIHGSPYPKGVGVRSSHGCIRMLNEDVSQLFKLVRVGTPVTILHQSTKIGRMDNNLYLEAHVPVSHGAQAEGYQSVGSLLQKVAGDGKKYNVEWHTIERLQNKANGIPSPIGNML